MSTFNFQSIQTLAIGKEDSPHIDVRDGQLILTAERNNERIMITAPLNSVLPVASARSVSNTVRRSSRKGRRPIYNPATDCRVGERNHNAKLTPELVAEIRAVAADESFRKDFKSVHEMCHAMGEVYKVHFTTVYNILNNRSWKHIQS